METTTIGRHHVRHRLFDAGEVNLHVAETGAGPSVVLLHGFPEFWYAWRHQIPALADAGYRVIAPDLRGYNRSDKPPDVAAYRIDRLAADIQALARSLAPERVAIVGHDWGGLIAWQVAAVAPGLVDRLVIMNAPHPARFLRRLPVTGQLLRSSYAAFFQLPWLPEWILSLRTFALMRLGLRLDARSPSAFTRDDLRRYVHAWSQPNGLRAPINYYRAAFRWPWSQRPVLARRVECPVLVIWGERDRFLQPELARPDPRWVPQARVERLRDASHWVHLDEPETVNRLLIEFLAGPSESLTRFDLTNPGPKLPVLE